MSVEPEGVSSGELFRMGYGNVTEMSIPSLHSPWFALTEQSMPVSLSRRCLRTSQTFTVHGDPCLAKASGSLLMLKYAPLAPEVNASRIFWRASGYTSSMMAWRRRSLSACPASRSRIASSRARRSSGVKKLTSYSNLSTIYIIHQTTYISKELCQCILFAMMLRLKITPRLLPGCYF